MGDVREGPEFLQLQSALAGRYSLVREVGRGGMGIVFLAQDVALERPVAIKLFPPHLAADESARERFLREARTAAQLMHPNVVPIHAVESRDGLVFFVMAFIHGETLTERVRRLGPLRPDDALRVMREVAWALAYAHGRGIVHRDIKPDNILLEHASGRALVADFGIARVTTRETLSPEGALVGTVQYMSPEQASAEDVDARSDLYSLGATTWFALTGSSPVEAPTLPMMLTRLLTEEPPPLVTVRADCPPRLAEAVMRTLARDRAHRFASADDLGSALQDAERSVPAVRPEVRAYLRELTAAKVFAFGGVGLAALAGAMLSAGLLPAEPGLAAVAVGGALVLGYLATTAGGINALRRMGVPRQDILSGLDTELADIEATYQGPQSDVFKRSNVRAVGWVTLLLGALITGIASLLILPKLPGLLAGGFLLVGLGYSACGVLLLRAKQLDARWVRFFVPGEKRGWSADDLLLRLVRRVLRTDLMSRYFARRVPDVRPAAAPTATLLLQRVEELIGQLPDGVRARLGDLLPAAAGLERAHAGLRSRISQLDAAIAELPVSSSARAEFARAREQTAARLSECVSALEGVRTDLLRLGAGLIGADGITAELEKAKELGAAIDAELQGLDEVRRITR